MDDTERQVVNTYHRYFFKCTDSIIEVVEQQRDKAIRVRQIDKVNSDVLHCIAYVPGMESDMLRNIIAVTGPDSLHWTIHAIRGYKNYVGVSNMGISGLIFLCCIIQREGKPDLDSTIGCYAFGSCLRKAIDMSSLV